ncbi:MAG TPA: phosphonate ABC transporter, permease protein PhnE [Anaerolineae bacterium]|nr:phosphonate ABC transporter, permease protein PhnE [Anaerolineae bacterium]
MASSVARSSNASRTALASLLSLVIPGAGQFYLGKRWRGVSVFVVVLALGWLIQWGYDNFEIAKVAVSGFAASWLWLLLIVLWAWNVLDAWHIARGESSRMWLALLAALAIVFTLAWSVTDVRLDRLVTRFPDAVNVMKQLVQPDLVTRDEATGALTPSENFTDIFGKLTLTPAIAYAAGKLVETIAIGLLATVFSIVLAIPLSFLAARNVMSRVPGGMAVYGAMRTFFNVVRAVDPIIWGLILIVWIGLGNLAAILALTIHSVAALGKLYSEEIEHIDAGPLEAVTSTGANLTQAIRFAVVPQIVPPFLAYTLLRWDINMRAATIVGVVAGGGIGFFIIETLHKGAYTQYAAALWAIAMVIIIVDFISERWRARILSDEVQVNAPPPRSFFRSPRNWVYLLLFAALFIYSWYVTKIDLRAFFDPAPTFGRMVGDFLRIDLTPDVLEAVIKQMLITIFQALIATALGGVVAIPFSFLAAHNMMDRTTLTRSVYRIIRSFFNVMRSIEALMYVGIFVAWVGIGNFAGALALAITTFALLGKLFSEAIENIDEGPLEAVTATGATRIQAIIYAIVPQIVPPFVSYAIYQWDINIRIATIIGFAGGGGIGLLLNTYFGQLQYHKAGTVVLLIVIVVAAMDFASAKIRQKLV